MYAFKLENKSNKFNSIFYNSIDKINSLRFINKINVLSRTNQSLIKRKHKTFKNASQTTRRTDFENSRTRSL